MSNDDDLPPLNLDELEEEIGTDHPEYEAYRLTFLIDHIVGLADQLGRLREMLARQGIDSPADLGQFVPPADDATTQRIVAESTAILNRRVASSHIDKDRPAG